MLLAEALGIQDGDVVALTGGGGKTTALYRLGDELAARGGPVVLTGTTRFTAPVGGSHPNLRFIGPDASPEDTVVAGPWPLTLATGTGSNGRLQPLNSVQVCRLVAARPEIVIVMEADGSALRPFKAPANHEPVVPDCATVVVTICGLDVLGRPLDGRAVHRPERVAELAGAALGAVVDERMVSAVLLHPQGGRKGLPPSARWLPLLNKADTPALRARAEQLADLLLSGGAGCVVIASLRDSTAPLQLVQPAGSGEGS